MACEDDTPADATVGDRDTPADDSAGDDTGSSFLLGEALESLERPGNDADGPPANSETPGRIDWSPVTKAESEPAEPVTEAESGPAEPDSSTGSQAAATEDVSFRFDLGSALARLGGDVPDTPALADEPECDRTDERVTPPTTVSDARPRDAEPVPRPPTASPDVTAPDAVSAPQPEPAAPSADRPERDAPDADPLLREHVPAPSEATATPTAPTSRSTLDPAYRRGAAAGAVFDDRAPTPTLPTSPTRAPSSASADPAAPVTPPDVVASLPTLPATAPSMPAPVSEPTSAASEPDIRAVRSFQLKAQREQRHGRVFVRAVVVLLLLAAAVVVALAVGRSYLFPTEWDSALTPIVDQIQRERGGEFDEAVPLVLLPAEEYAPIVLELSVGDAWTDRIGEWRALGVATGPADSAETSEAVVAWRPAIFDPATNRIVQVADGDPDATAAALTVALEEVYERQQGVTPNDSFDAAPVGVLGVSSLEAINSRAIDRHLLGPTATFEAAPESQVPLPLLYHWLAIDSLGEPLVMSAGPEASTWSYGDVYPDEVLAATDVSHDRAITGPLPEGAESMAEPVSLGIDNWSLVWRNRLPERTVERLATHVSADAYRPVRRGGIQCFVAAFETASETAAADLLGSMALWVSNGPASAEATATLVSPTQIELFSCDPGVDARFVVDSGAVDAILVAQIGRL